jgi:hypothetical protein
MANTIVPMANTILPIVSDSHTERRIGVGKTYAQVARVNTNYAPTAARNARIVFEDHRVKHRTYGVERSFGATVLPEFSTSTQKEEKCTLLTAYCSVEDLRLLTINLGKKPSP